MHLCILDILRLHLNVYMLRFGFHIFNYPKRSRALFFYGLYALILFRTVINSSSIHAEPGPLNPNLQVRFPR